MHSLLFLLLCAVSPFFASAAWSDGDLFTANTGAILSTFNLNTNSSIDCYTACVANSSCNAWTMHIAGCSSSSSSSLSAPLQATCMLHAEYGIGGYSTMEGSNLPCKYDACAISGPVNRITQGHPLLQTPSFYPTTTPANISPQGWLLDQLLVQGSGLTGYLALFWGPVSDSIWIGGNADGYLHEDFPYMTMGATILSGLVGDAPGTNLTAQLQQMLDIVVNTQSNATTGWLGPDDTKSGDQYWCRFNMIAALMTWADLYPATNAPTYYPVIFRYIEEAKRRMILAFNNTPGYWELNDWSAARVSDYLISLYALIDRFEDLQARGLVPAGISEATIYDAAAVAHAQAIDQGANWELYFGGPDFPQGQVTSNFGMLTHGVNVAQAIKSAGVWWRQNGNQTNALVNSTFFRMHRLDTYHGSPSGVTQADEHLAGAMNSHGTETCGVVEAAFSYEMLGMNLGNGIFFDRAELIVYNALPAAFVKDMWGRNYLSQANEIMAAKSDPRIWLTDGDMATVYGLETNFVCCTANYHQGYPRFVSHMHGINSATGGVAILLWGPAKSNLTLPSGGTGAVSIDVVTDYPFGDTATVTVNGAPIGTPVSLRVPSWSIGATLSINGGVAINIGQTNAGGFYTTNTTSSTVSTYVVNFNPSIEVTTNWYNNASAVYRGALLYALQLEYNETKIQQYQYQAGDWEFFATSEWNLGLEVDPSNPSKSLTFTQVSPPISPIPYNSSAWPVEITGTARVLPGWIAVNNSAAAPLPSPVDCTSVPGGCGASVPVRLIPYGSTNVRMAVLPWILPGQ